MRIALAQIDPIVGDFEGNVSKILKAYERAADGKSPVRLLLAPELAVSGYPPHDLMDRPEMFTRTEKALERIAQATKGKKTALAVGHVARTRSEKGRAAQNCVTVFENGKAVFSQAKTLLPTYDVFDEARYFEPSVETKLWETDGLKVAIAICEDLWGEDRILGRRLYGKNPVDDYERLKPDLLISCSASPYEFAKRAHREELHGHVAKRLQAPVVYVNQVGATDDILFDGASFATDATGKVAGRLVAFDKAYAECEIDFAKPREKRAVKFADDACEPALEDQAPADLDVLIRALVTGIREYFSRTNFKLAILGLSGGIDSALVAALAVKALGPKNVLGVAMPSQYSSAHSLSDAEESARRLGIPFEVRPIKFLFSAARKEIGDPRGGLSDIAQENLQARLRGMTLMALSNHYNALVLTTGNKSEVATGYSTLYGDMCGALAPIGDVLKTRVYEISNRLNEMAKAAGEELPIPESSITKAPSAELKPDQKDQDTLPPYPELDALLEDYVEKFLPIEELEKKHGKWTRDILRRIELNEYKRRQGAPILKVSTKAFGVGRRVPIAKIWDQKV